MIEMLCKNSRTGEFFRKKYILSDDAKQFLIYASMKSEISVLEITETRFSPEHNIVSSKISIS